jgi:hypothetical protein
LPIAICRLPIAICHLPFAICRLPSRHAVALKAQKIPAQGWIDIHRPTLLEPALPPSFDVEC